MVDGKITLGNGIEKRLQYLIGGNLTWDYYYIFKFQQFSWIIIQVIIFVCFNKKMGVLLSSIDNSTLALFSSPAWKEKYHPLGGICFTFSLSKIGMKSIIYFTISLIFFFCIKYGNLILNLFSMLYYPQSNGPLTILVVAYVFIGDITNQYSINISFIWLIDNFIYADHGPEQGNFCTDAMH